MSNPEILSSSIQTIIITGGNSGLGLACAKALLMDKAPFYIIIACRDTERANAAVEELRKVSFNGSKVASMALDLASLASVHAFATALKQQLNTGVLPSLHGIVCNAGTQGAKKFTLDGFEMTFGVNHLGHYLLVKLLMPLLSKPARIVVVASGTHDLAQMEALPSFTRVPGPAWNLTTELAKGTLGVEAANDDEYANMGRRYATSKLANIYFTYGLAQRLPEQITVNAFDPGMMPGTGLAREYSSLMRFVWFSLMPKILPLMRFLLVKNIHTPKASGTAMARLVTDPGLATTNGKYFEGLKEIRSSVESYDQSRADELWESSASLTDIPNPVALNQ
jgi:NAD(P)-dependent dehydrogenase (short-subunit alcohol dehydrogenase family)